ncbi:MAG: histidinol-phosphate transaminase [Legionella sp.]|nr:histidinol-phosphate transaminase [Legionella sp.]
MSCNYQQLPHIGIRTLHPYVPGKSIEELAKEQGITDIIKMASNENPLGCSPLVREALAKMSAVQIATYPTPALHPLKYKLSQKLGIDEQMLTFGNGSDLLFTLLLIVFGLHNNKHMLTHDKAFMTYAIQAQTLGIEVKSSPLLDNWAVDITALIAASNQDTSLIFIANPNNPTGILIPQEEIRRLLASVLPSTIVVIDEAYYEYAYPNDDSQSLKLLNEFPNLVITRTFSKAYGLAGLRLGYAIANKEISELLQRAQLPFVVNQAAMAAAFAALDDNEFLSETLTLNQLGLQQIRKGLEALKLNLLPSECNFITFDCGTDSMIIYQKLLQRGIIVRPLTAYGLPHHLRVSIGKLAHNERFLNELSKILS